jgi:hypothetical protein
MYCLENRSGSCTTKILKAEKSLQNFTQLWSEFLKLWVLQASL